MRAKAQLIDIKKVADADVQRREGRLARLISALTRRKVCRAGISYVLILWLNLQIGDVLFPLIGVPDWSLSLIIIIGVMGFPVVLLLAWVFQVTPAGIVVDEADSGDQPTVRQLDTAINLLLLMCSIVLSVLLLLQFMTDSRTTLPIFAVEQPSQAYVISTLAFEPAGQEPAGLQIAEGIHEELVHQLITMRGIDLLPDDTQLPPGDSRRRLALAGSLRLEGSTAHVLAHLIDLQAARYLMSVTFNLSIESAVGVERKAAEMIVSEIGRSLLAGSDALARTPEGSGLNDPA